MALVGGQCHKQVWLAECFYVTVQVLLRPQYYGRVSCIKGIAILHLIAR